MQLIGYTTSHSLHVKVHYGEGVLLLEISGCMTVDSFCAAAAYAALRGASQPWTVVVYDLGKAVMLLDERLDAPPIASALTRIGRPGAYVCTEDMREMMQRTSWRLASHGLERKVFTSSRAGLGWARGRALQIAARSERALARVRLARLAQREQAAQRH